MKTLEDKWTDRRTEGLLKDFTGVLFEYDWNEFSQGENENVVEVVHVRAFSEGSAMTLLSVYAREKYPEKMRVRYSSEKEGRRIDEILYKGHPEKEGFANFIKDTEDHGKLSDMNREVKQYISFLNNKDILDDPSLLSMVI